MEILFHAASVVARLRGARVMHPRGRSFKGTLVMLPRATTRSGHGVAERLPAGTSRRGVSERLPAGTGRRGVTVRLSKATPTPRGWPDVFGLAIRLGDRFDLLVTSSSPRPLLRHLFLPARGPATFYSSLAAYRDRRDRLVYLGARVDPGARSATLAVASRFGRWVPVARVLFGRRLSRRVDRRLAFNPVRHALPGLTPASWIHRLRDPVYRGSQHGRSGRGR
ncbi:hypothetical protein GCM10009557_48910 [Virgisporangium ochraceum]